MGCRHSQVYVTESKKQHADLRKKVSDNLAKSRQKHISSVLASSAFNLTNVESTPSNPDSDHPDHQDVKDVPSTDNGFQPGTKGFGRSEAPDSGLETKRKDSGSSSSSSSSGVEEEEIRATHASPVEHRRPGDSVQQAAKSGVNRTGRPSFKPISRYHRSSSFHDEVDRKAAKIKPADYTFHFENIVFEGGGNKGLAYCGAARYLEELGVMSRVKRFAGASAGGMVAGLMAVGYNSWEIEQFLSDRIDRIFLDACCGYCSFLPNILSNFGWNPGVKIYDWFGDKLKEKTDNADVTFLELYQKKEKILCIIVTNLNQMTTEYCHPKTTPDMPIRVALRMSMAIPGLFSAVKYSRLGEEDVYVDGGVLCNYPIHCFDGWYLSMDPKDSFLRRLQPLRDIPIIMERNNRFDTYNDKTLGMLLYSDAEEDILRINLERRVGCLQPARPEPLTKLFQQREKEACQKRRAEREYAQVVQAVDSFLRVLKKHNMDNNDVIDRQELEAAFKDEKEFPRQQAEVLFGEDFTVNQAFQLLDRDNNGQIRYDELLRFIEENGVSLQSRFLGYQRREIKNIVSFLNTLKSTLTFNVQKLYVEKRDLDRTVGINTGHVHTTDFVLEPPDREFVVQRGYHSMEAFLRYYVVCHPDKVTPKAQDKSLNPDIPEVEQARTSHSPSPTTSASASAAAQPPD